MSEGLKHVQLYTDGGADPNPGPGGYGAVLLHEGRRKELSGAFRLTTNNRMELLAAIVGLEAIKVPCQVAVHSDSQYLVRAMEKRWPQIWQSRNWQRKEGGPVANVDLWKRLLELCSKHQVEFSWVPGHSGIAENERCDELAARARLAPDLPVDAGYLEAASAKAQRESAQPGATASAPAPASPSGGAALEEGGPCRKCGTQLVRRVPRRKKAASKLYVYEYYLYCVACRTMYMIESAKISPADLARRKLDERRDPPPPTPHPPGAAGPGLRRAFELVLSPKPDMALFRELAGKLERVVAARPGRALEGDGYFIQEFRLDEVPFSLELHPERGVSMLVRGKRRRDLLRRLAERLRT